VVQTKPMKSKTQTKPNRKSIRHKIILKSFTFSHHHLISSFTIYFVSTKKQH